MTYEKIRKVLLDEWDPIDIRDQEAARDEYDTYVRRLHTLLACGSSASVIETYLIEIEADRMGLAPDRERARRVAEILLNQAS